MSVYLSYAPSILATEVENASALPDAPLVEPPTVPARSRFLVAAILRRMARLELAVAARLERPARHHLAAA